MVSFCLKKLRKSFLHILLRLTDKYFQLFSKNNINRTIKTYYKCAGRNVFFGYNDRSPLSSLGDVVLAHRTKDFRWNLDSPNFPIEVGYFQYDDGERFYPIAKSNAWSLQQGSMLQFLPNTSDRVMFNDFCGESYLSRIYSLNGESIRDLPFAFYSISSDLAFITAIDFERLSFFRPGYGYNCIGHRDLCLNDPVAYRILMFSDCSIYREVLYEELEVPPDLTYCSYVNHLLFSFDNQYLALFLVHQYQNSRRITVVIHDLINDSFHKVNNEGMPSHFCWKGAKEFVVTIRDERLKWSTNLYRILENGEVVKESSFAELTFDSHPAYTSGGKLIIDKAHISLLGQTELFEYSLKSSEPVLRGRFWSPSNFRGPLRSDLHHRLVRKDEELHMDIVKDGVRCSAILSLDHESSIH